MYKIYNCIGRKKKHHVETWRVLQYMVEFGCPPKRASCYGYWYSLARAVSRFGNPSAKFINVVRTNWYCNREGIHEAYKQAVSVSNVTCTLINNNYNYYVFVYIDVSLLWALTGTLCFHCLSHGLCNFH